MFVNIIVTAAVVAGILLALKSVSGSRRKGINSCICDNGRCPYNCSSDCPTGKNAETEEKKDK